MDNRVPVHGILKYVEKLRDLSKEPTCFPDFGAKNIVVHLEQNEGTGHFGSVDNESNLSRELYEFAWLDFLMFTKEAS